ncbi:DUF202 domain-containing protein [Flavihumibacter fluvii]|uniref:DUF202 domain-containing protein n=1 Tax=Flavihumibacter fluvii TaxID=2838157 RepID=UPI001BDE894D|nr:DUF202 domain-containing protein [Flavihumibacter fluvii]ULQ53188.1 DUF202 domain-containing protein [Flavihumibacter fluvii]
MPDEIQKKIAAEKDADPRVDLAVERTELALERTHLAWIRTTFSIMTAGVALDKGLAIIHEQRLLKNEALVKNGHFIGLFLTIFGTLLLLIETYTFIRRNRQLAAMKMVKASFFSTGAILSFLVLFLGFVLTSLMIYSG